MKAGEPVDHARAGALPIWIVLVGLILPMLAVFALPGQLEDAVAVHLAAVGFSVAGVWALSVRPRVSSSLRASTVALLAVIGIVLFATLIAEEPALAAFGSIGRPNGSAQWIVALGAMVVVALIADGRVSALFTTAIAGVGAVVSASAVGEVLGFLTHGDAWSPEIAGWTGSSNTLAQFGILGLWASLALWHRARGGTAWRAGLPLLGVALNLVAVVLSQSRAAWVAVVIGIAVWLALRYAPRGATLARTVFAVLIAGVILLPLVLGATALGTTAEASLADVLSGRVTLWRAAMERVSASPLTGIGPGTFDAFLYWTPDQEPSLPLVPGSTASAHSILLEWLLMLGALGATASAIAIGWAFWPRQRGALQRPGDSSGVLRALGFGPATWLLACSVSAVEPSALLLAGAMSGLVLRGLRTPRRREASGAEVSSRVPFAAVALALALVIALDAGALATAVRFTYTRFGDSAESARAYSRAFDDIGDPEYASRALQLLLRSDDPDAPAAAQALAERTSSLHRKHARLGWLSATAWSLESGVSEQRRAELAAAAIDDARRADPTWPGWEYIEFVANPASP